MNSSSTEFSGAFKRVAWSNLAAQLAEQIGLAASPIIAVLALGAGPGETGFLQTAQTLPFLILALPAGILADNVSRRGLMACAEAVRALALLAIVLVLIAGGLTLPLLGVLGFLGATGTVVYSVTAPAMVPSLVPRAALPSANGRLELARSTAFVAGPAVGGALVGWIGAPIAFGAAAALSTTAVFLLAGLPRPERQAVKRNPITDLIEGARFVFANAMLRAIVTTSIAFNMAYFTLQAVYVPYAMHDLGLDASGVGLTLGLTGAGMLGGALLAPRLSRWLPFGVMLVLGPVLGLAGGLSFALTIVFPVAALAGLGFLMFGVGLIIWMIATTTLRQAITPDGLLGRVSALIIMATFGARPIGAAIGAAVGGRFGAEACLLVALAGFALQFLLIMGSTVARLSKLPDLAAVN